MIPRGMDHTLPSKLLVLWPRPNPPFWWLCPSRNGRGGKKTGGQGGRPLGGGQDGEQSNEWPNEVGSEPHNLSLFCAACFFPPASASARPEERAAGMASGQAKPQPAGPLSLHTGGGEQEGMRWACTEGLCQLAVPAPSWEIPGGLGVVGGV